MIQNFKTYLVNSLGFHWSLDLTTLEDNLLLQSVETPHRCPQLFAHKHKIEVYNIKHCIKAGMWYFKG